MSQLLQRQRADTDRRSEASARQGRSARLSLTDLGATAIVTLLVASPMLFTSSGFAVDFTNHLWLSWVAGKALAHDGYPSYFLNTAGLGVFYPQFAFYGGTLYAITGALGEALGGHPVAAYVAVTMAAIAGAYAGTLSIARQLGLRGWMAHAPALVVVTGAYYVTDLYGRGAWPEFVATSAMAPLLASALHLARAPVWRPLPVLAFVTSAVIFTGSHNITLLWGTTVTGVVLLVLWLALGAPRRLPYRRFAMLITLGIGGLLVNAWFLFPDLAYAANVAIGQVASVNWPETSFFNTPAVVLDPFRHVPAASSSPGLFVQAPDWFLAWGAAAGGLLIFGERLRDRLGRAWVALAILIALLLTMMVTRQFWQLVPYPFTEILFPYRLGSYLLYTVAGLVLVCALALQRAAGSPRRRRRVTGLRGALVFAAAVSVALCVWQEWVPNTLFLESYTDRAKALTSVAALPLSWYDEGSYDDALAVPMAVPGGRRLTIDPRLVQGDRFAGWVNVPPGLQPIQTNIAGGSYLVHISGLERIGRNDAGYAVVRRTGDGDGPVHVVVQTAHSTPIELGRVTSVASIALILLVLVATAVRARRPGAGPLGDHTGRLEESVDLLGHPGGKWGHLRTRPE